jgi:CHAT domain-containing protein
LSYAPFAALKPKLKGSKHLIENHPIGYASSIRTLGWATNQFITLKAKVPMSSRHPMLLVGDPELPPEMNKDPIEDAALEVNAIASLLPTNYSNTLTKKQATLENVSSAMKTASWFHIACHGEVSPDLYPEGALFLSCDSGDHRRDGCLTSEIIINEVRCMTAQAAVLSACKAAQGKKTREGILGLARALMQAGVPLVVAPLKTIDSKLGSAFMQRFYKGLVDGESVMFALRNTMVDVIHKKIPVDDEDGLMEWQLWDWAAWVAVGFPGVCLPI